VAQLATAIVLLAGTGLLGRSWLLLSHTDVGLDARERVVTLSVPIGESSRTDKPARLDLVDALVERARQLPGVLAAGFGSNLPPSSRGIVFTVRYSSESRDESRTFDVVPSTPGYLEAMGVRLVRGRLFSADDARSGRSVAVLSETALRHLGQPLDVVDRELNMALPVDGGPRVKPLVIGVVRDVRYAGLDAPADGNVYVLWRQIPLGGGFLTLRTAGDPTALGTPLREIVRSADSSMPAGRLQTLEGEVDRVLAPRAARFGLVGAFAAAAIILALVGLSSALIRSVMERHRELAIRAAMGATPVVLVRSVVLHGVGLAALGAAIGVAAAIAAGRAASSMILGIRPHDPLTYGVTVATVTLVVLGACYVPARRAAAADPIALLHAE
jgi:putative ABC transport system permease protein